MTANLVNLLVPIMTAVVLIGGLTFLGVLSGPDEDHSVGWHMEHGKWRVRYPDGQLSQPFTRKVAEDYKELYGGEVIPK